MELIQTNKGGTKLCFEGFMYTKRSKTKNFIQWACSQRNSLQCKGSLVTTIDMENPEVKHPHCHDSNSTTVEVAKLRNQIKSSSQISKEKSQSILSSKLSQAKNDVRAEVGRTESIKRSICRIQRGALPKEPKTLEELVIEGEWTKTSAADPMNFLVHDSGVGKRQRVIVFATDEVLRHLVLADTLGADCTFSVAPLISSYSMSFGQNLENQQ